ncbi:NfeD family protein [Rapidithrix thailandica]|uniref:NfeD family protein n=1 Tax=Rapidithrix thailandica TaxID=413964 RepID=A0AAW9S4Q0_9BACT
MAEWVTVISLILFGVFLIIVEVIFIPGTTFVGVIGSISAIIGVVLGYRYFGSATGTWIMVSTLTVSGTALYYSFKSGAWDKLALKQVIESKVNEDDETITLGTEGITVSALRPIGSAEFDDEVREVRTMGNFLDVGTKVKVVRVEGRKIYVEAIVS